jgi:hypothetical protein
MKTSIYKLVMSAAIIFSAATILNSCSKADTINDLNASSPASLQMTGTVGNSILNHDLVITNARDDNADISDRFKGITFHFTHVDSNNGPAAAWNDILTVNGTWSMQTTEGTTITFAFPTNIIADLAFMNKEWSIQSSGNVVVLIAANGENDTITFTARN